MLHNQTKQDTYNNAGQTDFPSLPTNCDKLVIRRERGGKYALGVLDVTELNMRRCVPKCDSTFCRVCDKLLVLRQGNVRAIVAVENRPFRDC